VTTTIGETPTSTEPTVEGKPDDGLVKWAKVRATPRELMTHPLIQITLDLGVVVPPPTKQPALRRSTREAQTATTTNVRTVRTKADLKPSELVP